jgi:hypothetical protein
MSPDLAQQAYVSSEVFQVQKAGVKANFFLFSEHGYPPYGLGADISLLGDSVVDDKGLNIEGVGANLSVAQLVSPGAADPCRCHLPAGAER